MALKIDPSPAQHIHSHSTLFLCYLRVLRHRSKTVGFPGGSAVKNLPANAGDVDLISGTGRSPRGRHGNPLQYSCLGNPMDREAWRAIIHGVTKSWA